MPLERENTLVVGTAAIRELYLTGRHLEQYRHATRSPEPYWREALTRDPGHSPTHTALAAGFSVTEYVKRLRMARARQLLITSDHTVAEIAAAVGYPDPFYFSRQFSAVNGVSPREFRARVYEEASLEQRA